VRWLGWLVVNLLVPALPIISDPELFYLLVHSKTGTSLPLTRKAREARKRRLRKCRLRKQTPVAHAVYLQPVFSENFKDLAWYGDQALKTICERLVVRLWGCHNRRLANLILNDWLSNDNWLWLALVYGIGGMVRGGMEPVVSAADPFRFLFNPNESIVNRQKRRCPEWASLKAIADLFEAYFHGVLFERDMWGDSTADVEQFFF